MLTPQMLTPIFGKLRKAFQIIARQDFLCCSSCGHYEMHSMHKDNKYPGRNFYMFYHSQDMDRFLQTGEVCLAFGCFDNSDPVPMMKNVVAFLRNEGITVDWMEADSERPQLSLDYRKKKP